VKDSKSSGNALATESKKSSASVAHKDEKPSISAQPVKSKDVEVSGDVKHTSTGSSLTTKTDLPTSNKHAATTQNKKPDEVPKKIPLAKKSNGIPISNGKSQVDRIQVKHAAGGAAAGSGNKDNAVPPHSSSRFPRKVANGNSKMVEAKREDVDEDENVVPDLVAPVDASPVEQQILTELATAEKDVEHTVDAQKDHEPEIEKPVDSIVHEMIASMPTSSVTEVEERQMDCLQNDVEDDDSATPAVVAELDDKREELLTANRETGTEHAAEGDNSVIQTTKEAEQLLVNAQEEDAEHTTEVDHSADLSSVVKQDDYMEELSTGENGAELQDGFNDVVETHYEDEDNSVVPVSMAEQIEKDKELTACDNEDHTAQSLEVKIGHAEETDKCTEDCQNLEELVDSSSASLCEPDNVVSSESAEKLESGLDSHDHISNNVSISGDLEQMTTALVSVIEQNENSEVLTVSGDNEEQITDFSEEFPIATEENNAQSKDGSDEAIETSNEDEYNHVLLPVSVVKQSENTRELVIYTDKCDSKLSSEVESSHTMDVEKFIEDSQHSEELQDQAPTAFIEPDDEVRCESTKKVESGFDTNNQITDIVNTSDIVEPLEQVSEDEQQENSEVLVVSGETVDQLEAENKHELTANVSEENNIEAIVKHEQQDFFGNTPDTPDILDAPVDINNHEIEQNLPSAEANGEPCDVYSAVQPVSESDKQAILNPQTVAFDPTSEWGEPQSLPAPTDNKKPSESKVANNLSLPAAASKKETRDKSADAAKKSDFKIPAPKAAAVPRKKASTSDKLNSTELVVSETGRRSSSSDNGKRSRLSLQPSEIKLMITSHSATADQKTTGESAVKTSIPLKLSGAVKKSASSKAIIPFYVDLAYLPTASGCSVDTEFFRRVRASHYVVSTADPDPLLLSHLADAKTTWDVNSEVIVLPTEDANSLREWYQANRDEMAALRIVLGTPASRCSINLLGSNITANRVEL